MDPYKTRVFKHIKLWTGKELEHEKHLLELHTTDGLIEELSYALNLYHVSQILEKYDDCEFSKVLRLDIVVNLIELFMDQDLREISVKVNKLIPFNLMEDMDKNKSLAYTWRAADKKKVFEYMCEACPSGSPNFATLIHRGIMRLREMPETARMLWDTATL